MTLPKSSDAASLAALSVCESLLLALTENGTLSRTEAQEVLEDAATTHRSAQNNGGSDTEAHAMAAVLIDRIAETLEATR